MGNEKLLEYYSLFDKLLISMTNLEGFDLELIKKALAELCEFFKISKGITEFYQSPSNEKIHRGDIFVGYDNGEEGVEIISRRIVTQTGAVVKCSVYRSDKLPPLTDDEYHRVDIVMRTVLSFISRHRLQGAVEKFAFYDEFGYRNVRYFIRYLEQLNEREMLIGSTAIYYNLRHFTLVNREIGRSNGDIVMRNYFSMMEKLIGDSGIVCHVGGDNFVAVFEDEILDDVLAMLKGAPVVYDSENQKRIMVSASTGVFRMKDDFVFEAPGDVMDRIMTSSQAAKMGGKDSIVFFDDKMEIDKEKRMKIQQMFPLAIKNEEFKVFYQPKIDIETGELVGAEALCRWFKDGRIVPPMDFIPVLEYNTDICKLDFYMLDHVCKDIRRWLDEGRKVVRVSVNLSRKHMMDVDLLDHIIKIVDKNNVPHKYIEIELTETTTDVEFRDLKRVVSGLQQAGICTSVDDFGMGYSSLNLIREVPWNVLKVDRSFLPLDDENSQSTRSVMFKYVVGMAKELGLECIAEGVETKKQVEILKNNKCLFAQGFFFDKPLPLDEFEHRLKDHNYMIQEE
ncbi:putative bifunctional diguanylate cyclase/phosphodiesterase [Ruminococcus flavefaciens]|uniref:Diguanylate cyclase/phosphodiesterase n=1 Tax=Ruminococcus flavefaciens TaxID=1265 RepID=A0A1M7H3V4_RUMFL|nr:bifunctional diguanylate cyclase/phosphodiesterase [Ruminococcus flavefaciens]SHM23073.1 diguanylate cyclase/phosphodiesterase [Ruminococcus flavefaciens]